jgi:hypothetical protein
MAKLSADEIILARKGHATDPKRDDAVQFARKVIETPAMCSFTIFFNNLFNPEKDFPAVTLAGSI